MKKPRKRVAPPTDWRSAFQGHAMRTSFCLSLTQPMLEFLCATADGVHWDRLLHYQAYGAARPDNWIASSAALEKRGLIVSGPPIGPVSTHEEFCQQSLWNLTPAGAALVELLKVAGIFIEADSAIAKKAKAS